MDIVTLKYFMKFHPCSLYNVHVNGIDKVPKLMENVSPHTQLIITIMLNIVKQS